AGGGLQVEAAVAPQGIEKHGLGRRLQHRQPGLHGSKVHGKGLRGGKVREVWRLARRGNIGADPRALAEAAESTLNGNPPCAGAEGAFWTVIGVHRGARVRYGPSREGCSPGTQWRRAQPARP